MEELAEATALSREEIVESLDAGLEVESIDRTYSQEDGSEISLLDRIDSRNAGERVSAGDREKEALLNRVQVSRMEKRILKTMRERLEGG